MPGCIETAAAVLTRIDHSIDPCEVGSEHFPIHLLFLPHISLVLFTSFSQSSPARLAFFVQAAQEGWNCPMS